MCFNGINLNGLEKVLCSLRSACPRSKLNFDISFKNSTEFRQAIKINSEKEDRRAVDEIGHNKEHKKKTRRLREYIKKHLERMYALRLIFLHSSVIWTLKLV